MKGITFSGLNIAIDYSGNATRGIAINTLTGEVFEGTVQDINFDEQVEKANAEATRTALAG